jgi:hypothetical protein
LRNISRKEKPGRPGEIWQSRRKLVTQEETGSFQKKESLEGQTKAGIPELSLQ